MDKEKFQMADSTNIQERQSLINEFCDALFEEEDKPWFISDEACLYDITMEDDEILQAKIKQYYGIDIAVAMFKIKLWQLIDFLAVNRV